MSITRIFSYFLAIIIFSVSTVQAFEIENIRLGKHPDKIRMVLDISEVNDFRAFVLQNPYRMVIDFPKFSWKINSIENAINANIKNIRQGKLTPDISRIVFDLEKPINIQSAFLLPKSGDKKDRLVIDYKITNAKEFQKNRSTIFGTLKVDKQKPIINELSSNSLPTPPANSDRPTALKFKKPLIIIDPGHGGQDPGTIGKYNIYEKNIVLSLAKELKKQLLATGRYRVLLTREKDVFIRLKNRVKFARKHEGDLFISLHVNSNKNPKARGVSIYTLSKKASDAQTAKLAEKENQADLMAGVDFNVEDEQVAFILSDFLINDTMNQSKYFANKLVSNIKKSNMATLHNPHRYANFAVLKAPDIPSILIETGFASNKKEIKLLTKPAYKRKLSKAIIYSIDSYFKAQL